MHYLLIATILWVQTLQKESLNFRHKKTATCAVSSDFTSLDVFKLVRSERFELPTP